MPSQTYHLKAEHMAYLDELCDESETLQNPSQALKYVLNDAMQRDIINEEQE
jgi:hypothetical protein